MCSTKASLCDIKQQQDLDLMSDDLLLRPKFLREHNYIMFESLPLQICL